MIINHSSSCSSFAKSTFTPSSTSDSLGTAVVGQGQDNDDSTSSSHAATLSESSLERTHGDHSKTVKSSSLVDVRNSNLGVSMNETRCEKGDYYKDDVAIFTSGTGYSSWWTLAAKLESPPSKQLEGDASMMTVATSGGASSLESSFHPVPSAIKTNHTTKSKSIPKRRVQWRWNEASADSFSKLCDSTLHVVISFLSMNDIVTLSAVSSRWRFLALQPECWKNVDATDFVRSTYLRVGSAEKAGVMLSKRLKPFSPDKLIIRAIGQCLKPESIPSINGLSELALTEFHQLSDTHVHVLLLSSSVLIAQMRSKISNSLRKLVLEDCHLITNASVRSIGSQCRQLEHLSLRGCARVDNILPLRDMFHIQQVYADSSSTHFGTRPSLQSMFVPPTMAAAKLAPSEASSTGLASLFGPPPSTAPAPVLQATSPKNALGGLASLFAPPVEAASLSVSKRVQIRSSGKLVSLNISKTGVIAAALLDAFPEPNAGVALELLEMKGRGESWNDRMLEKLGSSHLKVLDIGCADTIKGSFGVTDKGIRTLSHVQLERLCLSGQKGIRSGFLAHIFESAPKLRSLNVAGCPALFIGDAKNMATALQQKSRTLEYINISRCFSSEVEAGSSSHILKSDEERGQVFLDAVCKSVSRRTLRELDLSWCWFVTAVEVANVRKACPGLQRMHLIGTRCNQVVVEP